MNTTRSVDAIVNELRSNAVQGGTVSVLDSRPVPAAGYVVGQHGISGPSETLDFHAWVRSVLAEVVAFPGRFVGVWEDDGVTYLDVVKIHADLRTALDDARDRNELAIYDLAGQECVYLSDVLVSA